MEMIFLRSVISQLQNNDICQTRGVRLETGLYEKEICHFHEFYT